MKPPFVCLWAGKCDEACWHRKPHDEARSCHVRRLTEARCRVLKASGKLAKDEEHWHCPFADETGKNIQCVPEDMVVVSQESLA